MQINETKNYVHMYIQTDIHACTLICKSTYTAKGGWESKTIQNRLSDSLKCFDNDFQ